MRSNSITLLAVAFVACAAGGFFAAQARQPRPTPPQEALTPSEPLQALGGWLRLMPDQVQGLASVDPEFASQHAQMEADLAAQREKLASMFEDAAASNDEILEQVERVIELHDRLELQVAEYLLAIRPHLTDDQRGALFKRCAEGVRQAGGWRWRHGQNGRGGAGRGGGRGPRWLRPTAQPRSGPASQPKGDKP